MGHDDDDGDADDGGEEGTLANAKCIAWRCWRAKAALNISRAQWTMRQKKRNAFVHPRFELKVLARSSKEATSAKSVIPRPSPSLRPLPQPAFQKVHRLVVPVLQSFVGKWMPASRLGCSGFCASGLGWEKGKDRTLRESASPGGARPRTLRAQVGKSLRKSASPGGIRAASLFEKGSA